MSKCQADREKSYRARSASSDFHQIERDRKADIDYTRSQPAARENREPDLPNEPIAVLINAA